MPGLFAEAEKNLQKPVKLYAQLAIQSAHNIDPLFKESTAPLTKDLSEAERAEFRSLHKGDTYYFCSAQCRASFERDPAAYLVRD